MPAAQTVPAAITVEVNWRSDSLLILTTYCGNYSALRALPRAVTYDGIICALSSYDPDREWAVYRSDKKVGIASY